MNNLTARRKELLEILNNPKKDCEQFELSLIDVAITTCDIPKEFEQDNFVLEGFLQQKVTEIFARVARGEEQKINEKLKHNPSKIHIWRSFKETFNCNLGGIDGSNSSKMMFLNFNRFLDFKDVEYHDPFEYFLKNEFDLEEFVFFILAKRMGLENKEQVINNILIPFEMEYDFKYRRRTGKYIMEKI